MGEFDYDGPRGEATMALGKAERCRPDFEGIIEKEREKIEAVKSLYIALKEIVLSKNGYGFNTSKLQDLMGSCHVRMVAAEDNIGRLIKEQENYKD